MNGFADCGDQSIMAFDTVNFRKIAALIAASGTLFWLYTFYAIAHVPPGDGTGFQWLAVFPPGMVFGLFFLPAWLLVAIGRLPRFTAALGVCGLIAFAVLWAQLLQEFPRAVL
ncbi:hypothetical protein H8A97_07030 [Bradyrhizobium sp. Arg62]|nr:hypothetical protein [Bradyrhizobium brasilense]